MHRFQSQDFYLLEWDSLQMCHCSCHLEHVARMSKVKPVKMGHFKWHKLFMSKDYKSQQVLNRTECFVAAFTYLVCGDSIMTRLGREASEADGVK